MRVGVVRVRMGVVRIDGVGFLSVLKGNLILILLIFHYLNNHIFRFIILFQWG